MVICWKNLCGQTLPPFSDSSTLPSCGTHSTVTDLTHILPSCSLSGARAWAFRISRPVSSCTEAKPSPIHSDQGKLNLERRFHSFSVRLDVGFPSYPLPSFFSPDLIFFQNQVSGIIIKNISCENDVENYETSHLK